MNIKIQYGSSVMALPGAVNDVASRATATDLRVILALCADTTLQTADQLVDATGLSLDEITASLAFWRGTGILTLDGSVATAPADEHKPVASEPMPSANEATAESSAPSKKPHPTASIPSYTSDELADLLESRKETSAYLDECQRIWGKVFNVHEVNVILGLTDYLGLDWDYVLTLLAYSAAEQDRREIKRSLRYVETTAFSLYDEGVTDLPALQDKFRRMEQMEELVVKLRRLFGMGERSLTAKEKKLFSAWIHDYDFGIDMITRAFEITVDAKGSPNLKYMDAILTNWNHESIRTLADVDKSTEAFRAEKEKMNPSRNKKSAEAPRQGSFDTDDFFSAAVARSLGEDFVKKANTQGET